MSGLDQSAVALLDRAFTVLCFDDRADTAEDVLCVRENLTQLLGILDASALSPPVQGSAGLFFDAAKAAQLRALLARMRGCAPQSEAA
jgi:hypothetical protein